MKNNLHLRTLTIKLFFFLPAAAFLSSFAFAQFQEQAKVLSVVPMVKQVSAPQQVCGTSQVAVQEPKSGEGAVLGAIAGGVLGNSLGKGSGKGASSAIGAVGGAIVGNELERPKTDVQNVTTCSTQNTIQSITTYQVTYEYAGHQYGVEMSTPPGPYVNIQVNIAVQGAVAAQTPPAVLAAPPSGVIVPTGVAYVAPAYPAPGVGWIWEFNARYGWGWHHPRYGWHQGWR
jgi:uncharacterized protein YcfJ